MPHTPWSNNLRSLEQKPFAPWSKTLRSLGQNGEYTVFFRIVYGCQETGLEEFRKKARLEKQHAQTQKNRIGTDAGAGFAVQWKNEVYRLIITSKVLSSL